MNPGLISADIHMMWWKGIHSTLFPCTSELTAIWLYGNLTVIVVSLLSQHSRGSVVSIELIGWVADRVGTWMSGSLIISNTFFP